MFNEINELIVNVIPLPLEVCEIIKEYVGDKKEFLKDRRIKKLNNMYANFIVFLADESYKLRYTEKYLSNHINKYIKDIRSKVLLKKDVILYNFNEFEIHHNKTCKLCKKKIKKVDNYQQSLTYHLMYQCKIFNSF